MQQQEMELKKMELQNQKLQLEKDKIAEKKKPKPAQTTIIEHQTQYIPVQQQQQTVLPNCRGRHGLRLFSTPRSNFRCNSCNRMQRIRTAMYGCRACNYDLCQQCYNQLTIGAPQQIVVQTQKPTTTIQEVDANEACPKCNGNGFVHESNMNHKTGDPNKKCFFCEDCNGCKGKGFIKAKQKLITTTDAFGRATVQQVSSMSACPKCRGHGWTHTSSMTHKTGDPNKRCFFCENCNSCKGTGRIQT